MFIHLPWKKNSTAVPDRIPYAQGYLVASQHRESFRLLNFYVYRFADDDDSPCHSSRWWWWWFGSFPTSQQPQQHYCRDWFSACAKFTEIPSLSVRARCSCPPPALIVFCSHWPRTKTTQTFRYPTNPPITRLQMGLGSSKDIKLSSVLFKESSSRYLLIPGNEELPPAAQHFRSSARR